MTAKILVLFLVFLNVLAGIDKLPFEQRKLITRVHRMISKWLDADQLAEILNHVTDELYAGKDASVILTNLKDKILEYHTQDQKKQLETIKTAIDNAGLPIKSHEVGNTVHEVLSNNFRAVLLQMGDFAVNCHENGLSKNSTARRIYGLLSQFLTRNRSANILCRLEGRFQKDHWYAIKDHMDQVFLFTGDCTKQEQEDAA